MNYSQFIVLKLICLGEEVDTENNHVMTILGRFMKNKCSGYLPAYEIHMFGPRGVGAVLIDQIHREATTSGSLSFLILC